MLYAIVGLLFLLADQFLKYWTVANVELNADPGLELLGGLFHLTYIKNTGIAFNFLSGVSALRWILPALALIFAVFIILGIKFGYLRTGFARWTGVMLLTGLVGNAVDRAIYGYVVDMIEPTFGSLRLPIFNIADFLITVFGVLFIIALIRGGIGAPEAEETDEDEYVPRRRRRLEEDEEEEEERPRRRPRQQEAPDRRRTQEETRPRRRPEEEDRPRRAAGRAQTNRSDAEPAHRSGGEPSRRPAASGQTQARRPATAQTQTRRPDAQQTQARRPAGEQPPAHRSAPGRQAAPAELRQRREPSPDAVTQQTETPVTVVSRPAPARGEGAAEDTILTSAPAPGQSAPASAPAPVAPAAAAAAPTAAPESGEDEFDLDSILAEFK